MTFLVCFYILQGFIVNFNIFCLYFNDVLLFYPGEDNILLLCLSFPIKDIKSYSSSSKTYINTLDPNFVTGLTEAEGNFLLLSIRTLEQNSV